MVHVLGDSDVSILRMVYPLLQTAAKKRTEHVVIEAGVDTNEDTKFELPVELLHFIQTAIDSQISGPDRMVCLETYLFEKCDLMVIAESIWTSIGLDGYIRPI